MKSYIVVLITIIGIFFIGEAFAATGSSVGKITTLRWYEGHAGVLIIQENMSDLGDCGSSTYYILDDQHSYFNEIYSLILSAHIANQPLELTIDGCFEGYSRIKHLKSSK